MANQTETASTELQLVQAKAASDYALSPTGQYVQLFEAKQRIGKMLATSTIVPDTYKGNIGNCVIAIDMAERLGVHPMTVMQNLYIVHGNPAFSSKFLIASINASKRFSPLRYEFRGEEGQPNYGCRCVAYEIHDVRHEEPLYGDWITLEMAKKEGWLGKNGSKWVSMPNQMLRYRAAAFWQRVYCPEISMGLMTAEEAEDIGYAVEQPTVNKADEIRKRVDQAKSKVAAQAQVAEQIVDVEVAPAEEGEGNKPFVNVDPDTGEVKMF